MKIRLLIALVVLVAFCGHVDASTRRGHFRDAGQNSLRITEIMYHPAEGGAEFIEIFNSGHDEVDLSGVRFGEGLDFVFPEGSRLLGRAFAVLVRSPEVFLSVYPWVEIAGVYEGKLNNGGEMLILRSKADVALVSLEYHDRSPWPITADGFGFSMVFDGDDDPALASSWRASFSIGGSPGEADPDPKLPRVVVNEVLNNSDPPERDAIELANIGTVAADIRGWLLTDDLDEITRALIPDDGRFVLEPGAFVVIDESEFFDTPGLIGGQVLPGFRLSSAGESVYLFSADAQGQLTGQSHGADFPALVPGATSGRHVTSDGRELFVPQLEATLGSPNVGALIGSVVISQIHFSPLPGGIEFLVIENSGSDDVVLSSTAGGEEIGWRLKGVGYGFEPGLILKSGERLIVANGVAEDFRARYEVDTDTRIGGPFGTIATDLDASLRNEGETIRLQYAIETAVGEISWVTIDQVSYEAREPWPDADRNGMALVRVDFSFFADDPVQWVAELVCFGSDPCDPLPDPTSILFDPDRVIGVDIVMDEADWLELRQQDRSILDIIGGQCLSGPISSPFTYFQASVRVDGISRPLIGVRKKGLLGSLSQSKPSLKLKFDEYVDDETLSGMSRITLNNAQQDPSFINQCLGYHLFAGMGIPAPRCSFARVSVNGMDLGLYVHVESIDKSFLVRHFDASNGTLYEGTLSDFRAGWVNTFERKNNDAAPDRSDLRALSAALQVSDDDLVSTLEDVLDLDAFFTFWAVEVILGHWDGYAGNTNNFFVYNDPVRQSFYFLPWGIDALFHDDDPFASSDQPVGVLAAGKLAYRLYQWPPTRQIYVDRVIGVLDEMWDSDGILAEIDRMQALLAPHVSSGELAAFEARLDSARAFVRSREDVLHEALLPVAPEWIDELRSSPCVTTVGDVHGSFSTTWGTLDASDPFSAGTADLVLNLEGKEVLVFAAGSVAGFDDAGQAMIAIVALLGDGTIGIVALITDPELITDDRVLQIDWSEAVGALLHLDPVQGGEAQIIGLLAFGWVHLEEGATTDGAPIVGSFEAIVIEPL